MSRSYGLLICCCCCITLLFCTVLAVETPSSSSSNPLASGARTKLRNISVSSLPIASIMGESALMDKETGRVYWEGGSSGGPQTTIQASIVAKVLHEQLGWTHVQATITTVFLWIAVSSFLIHRVLKQTQFLQNVLTEPSNKKPWLLWCLVVLMKCTVLRVPKLDSWFLWVLIVGVYFLEAYHSETHRYLQNIFIEGTSQIENYLETLRQEQPIVTWKVRTFHYETMLPKGWFHKQQQAEASGVDFSSPSSHPALWNRKIVTQRAETCYQYQDCQDLTSVGVWNKATVVSSSKHQQQQHTSGLFTKISLSKLLVLANAKSRQDYFRQQAEFVTQHGQGDEYAEFRTDIAIQGFRPYVLVSSQQHRRRPKMLPVLFWCCTCFGMTLPFRVWFDERCDELRITVAKETNVEPKKKTARWLSSSYYANLPWFSSSSLQSMDPTESFRRMMQELSIYKGKSKDETDDNGDDEKENGEEHEERSSSVAVASSEGKAAATHPQSSTINDGDTAGKEAAADKSTDD